VGLDVQLIPIKKFQPLVLGLLLAAPFAGAQPSHSFLKNKHFVYAGIYHQDGDLLAESRRGLAEPVEFEFDNLGIDDPYTSAMLDYHYRLSERWQLSAAYYRFTDGASGQRLNQDISWEGQEFTAGVALDIDWNLDTYIVDIMYNIKRTDNFELSVGGGLHAIDVEVTVAGEVGVEGAGGRQVGAGETARGSLLAPLPNLRATGFYAFNDKWAVQGTLGWLSLGYEDYDGDFSYLHLRAQYDINDTVGVSLGYQYVDVDVTEDLRLGFRRFDMAFEGITAAVTFAF